MDGTYHTELENDGSSLLVTVESADRLLLRLAIPWEQITEAVSREVRARFVKGEVATHFVGSPRIGMHFSLHDLTESWIDRFDPSDEHSIAERDLLIGVFRDCLSRLEATATLE